MLFSGSYGEERRKSFWIEFWGSYDCKDRIQRVDTGLVYAVPVMSFSCLSNFFTFKIPISTWRPKRALPVNAAMAGTCRSNKQQNKMRNAGDVSEPKTDNVDYAPTSPRKFEIGLAQDD